MNSVRPSRFRAFVSAVPLVLLSATLGMLSHAANIVRGPYVVQGTTNGVVVRWRTDVATASFVRYGPSPANWSGQASNSTLVGEHVVQTSGLQTDTRYYYQVGTGVDWFTGDTNRSFFTSPPQGIPKPTRIWALGDAGTGNAEQVAVRDGYTAYNGTNRTDLWMMLGDNAYSSGTDAEYQTAVFEMYSNYLENVVLWPTIGNHDAGSTGSNGVSPYFDIFTLPTNGEAGGVPSGTEHYYSFDYANIHFICLDSAGGSDRTSIGPMANWLRADLASTVQEWIIPFWHHPPYTKGSHDSDSEGNLIEIRENLVPILESYGVDLVLCGHSHCYERSFLIDGHYGFSSSFTPSMKLDGGDGRVDGTGAYRKEAGRAGAHQGAIYTVAGSSGHTGGGSLNHPAMFISLDIVGSVVIDINGNRLDMVFVEPNAVVGDHVTIIKAPPPTNAPAAPTNLVAVAVSSRQINLAWEDTADNEAGFKLQRSTNGVDFEQIAIVVAGVTNRSDTGLTPETTYYYRVRAFNVVGDSADSNLAQATTLAVTNDPGDVIPPAAVTNLTVSNVTTNSVKLNWTAPGNDGDQGTAARYDIRYSTSVITENAWAAATQATGEPAPAVAGTSQSFTVNRLVSGITYYFALKTADETNNVSPLSNVPNATTVATTNVLNPPARPTGLVATAVATNEIDLVWTDNANNEDGFMVERSTNGVNFAQFATVGPSVTNLADRGLQPGSVNFYRVRAFNDIGDSAYSNTNSAQVLMFGGTTMTVLITSNSFWKYLDDGSDQSDAWTALTFDDSHWASGQAILGYNGGHEKTVVSFGGNAIAKYITTFFRKHITISDPSSITALTVSVLRDDGAVVYLNGAEVFRDNMPPGPINYLTVAASSVSGTNKTSYHLSPPISPNGLLVGDNVIAAEVHQRSGSSTQMDFDLQLFSTNAVAPPPSLKISLTSSNLVLLQWTTLPGKTYRVQYAAGLLNTGWSNLGNDVAATSTLTSATNGLGGDLQRFYRVLKLD